MDHSHMNHGSHGGMDMGGGEAQCNMNVCRYPFQQS